MSMCMIIWSKISLICRREMSSVLFWGPVESRTKILEVDAEYPLRSRMRKCPEEVRCYFGCTYGGFETGEGGFSKTVKMKRKSMCMECDKSDWGCHRYLSSLPT